jgi:hypothetical protein
MVTGRRMNRNRAGFSVYFLGATDVVPPTGLTAALPGATASLQGRHFSSSLRGRQSLLVIASEAKQSRKFLSQRWRQGLGSRLPGSPRPFGPRDDDEESDGLAVTVEVVRG